MAAVETKGAVQTNPLLCDNLVGPRMADLVSALTRRRATDRAGNLLCAREAASPTEFIDCMVRPAVFFLIKKRRTCCSCALRSSLSHG